MDGLKKIYKALRSLKWYETLMCIIMFVIAAYYALLPQEDTPQWLAIINFFSGLCGIVCVFFCAKANRMTWPFAVVNTIVYMIYLWYFGIWATFWLETLVYMPTNIIGWVMWIRHKDDDDDLLAKSKTLSWWKHIIVIVAIIGLSLLVHFTLSALAGDTWMRFAVRYGWNTTAMKWLDSLIFSIGVIATFLQMLRYKEQYIWWLITDVIAVAQYAIKKDAVYTTKKAIYLVEAMIGLNNWKTLAKKNQNNE